MKKPIEDAVLAIALVGCAPLTDGSQSEPNSPPLVAHLGLAGDPVGLARIREAFVRRNAGYDLDFIRQLGQLDATVAHRILFIQAGSGRAIVDGQESDLTTGDLVIVHAGERLECKGNLAALVFTVPAPPASDIPRFLRPDWDPRITDVPGGCATESGAYRRTLLTWTEENGPYIYHGLNAHRVRIMDSFTHYHPIDTGFDEFYLVQMTLPGARILTSRRTDAILRPQTITRDEATRLLRTTPLQVGDLVYLPRGMVHRGLGGVLAQIIAVPGFKPGEEIGVDHHLAAINERLVLRGDHAVPYHAAPATEPDVTR